MVEQQLVPQMHCVPVKIATPLPLPVLRLPSGVGVTPPRIARLLRALEGVRATLPHVPYQVRVGFVKVQVIVRREAVRLVLAGRVRRRASVRVMGIAPQEAVTPQVRLALCRLLVGLALLQQTVLRQFALPTSAKPTRQAGPVKPTPTATPSPATPTCARSAWPDPPAPTVRVVRRTIAFIQMEVAMGVLVGCVIGTSMEALV
ncbi:hypothetical protein T439DRAFT_325590, partial [Meredithblackwellia eburnea MCA 4105]